MKKIFKVKIIINFPVMTNAFIFPEAYHFFDEIPAKLWLTQGFLPS